MTDINLQNGFILGSVFKNNSNAKLLDYTVTFKSNNELFYISSCNGDSYITAPPEPTKIGETFVGWYSNYHEGIIDFPYFPEDNDTMIAQFQSARTEMQWSTSGAWLTDNYYSPPHVTQKINNELTVMASVYIGTGTPYYYVMLGKTSSSIECSRQEWQMQGNLEYDGQTWYYTIFSKPEHTITNVVDKSIRLDLPNSYYGQIDNIVKGVLDHYFLKD